MKGHLTAAVCLLAWAPVLLPAEVGVQQALAASVGSGNGNGNGNTGVGNGNHNGNGNTGADNGNHNGNGNIGVGNGNDNGNGNGGDVGNGGGMGHGSGGSSGTSNPGSPSGRIGSSLFHDEDMATPSAMATCGGGGHAYVTSGQGASHWNGCL